MKLRTKIGGILIAAVACFSMVVSPVFMADGKVMASDEGMTDEMYEQIDGMTVEQLKEDSDKAQLLEDPMFLRYFDISDSGRITKKEVKTDEVDEFIAKMDENAEGIDDETLVEMNSEMSCVGCGISGIGKAQVPKKYAYKTRYNAIDISWFQHKITEENWKKIKAAGVTHAIIRVGYSTLGSGEHNYDSVFSHNLYYAHKVGIKCGAYYYSTATSVDEAKAEARYTVSLLKNYKSKITLPVVYDYETGGRLTSSVMKRCGTSSCKAFCDYIKSAGYQPMIYANYTTLQSYLDYKSLESKYPIWLANYTTNGTATTYPGSYCMWQYSSDGSISGITGRVDMNYIFNNGQGGFSPYSYSVGYSATKPSTKYKSYKVTTRCKMNIRRGPSTAYKSLGSVNSGTTVYATSIRYNNSTWARLSNGYYMSLSCCKFKAKTIDTVNYRTGPGTDYKKIGTYSRGKEITVYRMEKGWAKMSNGYWLKATHFKIAN